MVPSRPRTPSPPWARRRARPLDDGGLADPWGADEDGVVGAATREHVEQALDLVVTPDHLVDATERRHLGEVSAELGERGIAPSVETEWRRGNDELLTVFDGGALDRSLDDRVFRIDAGWIDAELDHRRRIRGAPSRWASRFGGRRRLGRDRGSNVRRACGRRLAVDGMECAAHGLLNSFRARADLFEAPMRRAPRVARDREEEVGRKHLCDSIALAMR